MARKGNNVVDLQGRRRETNEQVLKRLFTEHSAALRAFLRVRMGVDLDDDMDDIVQEVFIKLADLPNLPERLPPDNKSNRSFLIAMANNLVVDMERHKSVRRRYMDLHQHQPEQQAQVITPETIALASEELDQVKAVIMDLNPRWREAFILNRFKRKTYHQIADAMGVSVKQVEKYMKQALLRIREAAVALKRDGRHDD